LVEQKMSSHISCLFNDDLVFDVQGGQKEVRNHSSIILYQKHGGSNQQFSLTYRGNGYHSIDLVGTDFVLDVEASNTNNGTNVILWKYHGGKNQLWMLEPNDSATSNQHDAYTFRSKADLNKVLDVNRGAAPNNLIIWDFHGGENQVFKMRGAKQSCSLQ